MVGLLNFLGGVALVVGTVLWVLMVASGLSNLREEKQSSFEPPANQTPQP